MVYKIAPIKGPKVKIPLVKYVSAIAEPQSSLGTVSATNVKEAGIKIALATPEMMAMTANHKQSMQKG